MIIELINEARAAGARLQRCCEVVELDVRTVQRWPEGGEDLRKGPQIPPANKYSEGERQRMRELLVAPEFVSLSDFSCMKESHL